MPCKTSETTLTIGEREVAYSTTQFAFEDAILRQAEVMALLGDSANPRHGLGSVLSGFGRAIIAAGGADFAYRMLKRTVRDGVKLNTPAAVAEAYEGNLGELVVAIEWVVRENFADFFGEGVRELIKKRLVAPFLSQMLNGGFDASLRDLTSPDGTSGPSPNDSDSP